LKLDKSVIYFENTVKITSLVMHNKNEAQT